jgi:hypothetical protein
MTGRRNSVSQPAGLPARANGLLSPQAKDQACLPWRPWPPKHGVRRWLIATLRLGFRLTARKISNLCFSNRDKIADPARIGVPSGAKRVEGPLFGPHIFSSPSHFYPFAYDFLNRNSNLAEFAAIHSKQRALKILPAPQNEFLSSPPTARPTSRSQSLPRPPYKIDTPRPPRLAWSQRFSHLGQTRLCGPAHRD